MPASTPVKAFARADEILTVLAEDGPLTFSELADAVGMPDGTINGYLTTMQTCGWLEKADGGYRLSLHPLALGGQRVYALDVYQAAYPEVNQLSRSTGKNAFLMVEDRGLGVTIHKHHGEDGSGADTNLYLGKETLLQNTAMGKSILAYMQDDRVAEIVDSHGFRQLTDATITTREELAEAREHIREHGFARNMEERHTGLCCVGAPVLFSRNNVFCAVGVSVPAVEAETDWFADELPHRVRNTTNRIQIRLENM
jgi:DNA-binding IclR family transcriptional regulator